MGRALDASVDMGITSIDTAPVYGFGLSEEIVGESIQGKHDRVQIMTKFGLRWDSNRGKFHFSSRKEEMDMAGKIKPGKEFKSGDSRPDTPYYKKENITKINLFLDRINTIAEDKGVSLAQLVLRWTLQRPGITCILAGARNEEQLVENSGTLEFKLSQEEMAKIDQYLEKLILNLDE